MGKRKTKVVFHPDYRIGKIDRRLFGAFLEPIGDWVYGGIWNPEHETADDLGFRKDILEQVKELGIPAVRLPGGNFTSGWAWKDSIGPAEQRKAHLDLAWRQYETNQVGHDEYLEWARRVGTEPLYTLNLGTGTIQDAMDCVEYTRIEDGTYWSNLRKQNGYEKPHQVHTWCLGNEMDGPWQISSFEKDPKGYGIKAHEISKAVKWIDPEAETVACGTSTPNNRTFPSWDLEVLKECYETVDYLSLHYYHNAPEGDLAAYLSASRAFEDFLEAETAACDVTGALLRHPKKMNIAFDEYGCSFSAQKEVTKGRAGAIDHSTYPEFSTQMERPFRFNDPANPPKREEKESPMLNSLALTSVLMMLLRHADRVKIACMTGGLFTIGHDEKHVWKQIGYYPYEMLIRYAKGCSLRPSVEGPGFDVKGYNLDDFNQCPAYTDLAYIEACASVDDEAGEIAVFLINRCWESELPVELDMSAFGGYRLKEHIELYTEDLYAKNTGENPYAVVPRANEQTRMENGMICAELKALSFNMIRLEKERD